jgi:putative ABC transport system permease protein
MFTYYLDLALRGLRRHKALTALMVLAIALGIGASMTTLTVLHVLSGDPLPGRSAHLYYPQVDPQDLDGYDPQEDPPAQVTWIDGMNLLHAGRADRQALMTGGAVPVQPTQANLDPFFTSARYTTADFFAMFDVPFLYGHGWNATDDDARARVVVINRDLNDKLFEGKDSTGSSIRVNDADLRIVGVLDEWRPNPHFYDLNMGRFEDTERLFVPLSTSRDLRFGRNGSMDCWGNGSGDPDKLESASCVWLQFWVELDTPAKAAAYREFLVNYSQDQKSQGRFQRPPNVRLPDVMEWLEYNKVVPSDVRLQTWLAFGFLAVCLINTVGLLLALGGLWLVRRQPADYAGLAHLDAPMLLTTFALAIGASLLAGLLPAWRACQVPPALQLKAQ